MLADIGVPVVEIDFFSSAAIEKRGRKVSPANSAPVPWSTERRLGVKRGR